jgi:hypothetical protein
MRFIEQWRLLPWRSVIGTMAVALATGCETPSAHTFSRNYGLRHDVPIDPPGAPSVAEDDCANGGLLFARYCGSCHNARPLGERPFSNYHVAVAHMRDQAYLTGNEYRQIIMFVRRWHDLGPPTPPVEPSPKRFVFSQPISELRKESPASDSVVPPSPSQGPWERPPATKDESTKRVPEELPSPIQGGSPNPAS